MAVLLSNENAADAYYSVGYNDGNTYYYRACESIPLTSGDIIDSVDLKLNRDPWATGNYQLTVRIETDNSDKPSGTLAHVNATGTWAGDSTETPTWRNFPFTSFAIPTTGKYWIVSKKTSESGGVTNEIYRAGTSTNGYAGGSGGTWNTNTSTWTIDATKDLLFRVNGTAAVVASGGSFLLNLI